MQTKTQEMYDRLIQLALQGVGYDPIKLGDALLRINKYNPSDFKKELPVKTETEARLEIQIELANQENKLIMQGQAVGGTPYIGPIHTSVHVQFMSSEGFQALPSTDPRVQLMTQHIMEELSAQSSRGGTMPMVEGTPGGGSAPGQMPKALEGGNRELTDLLTGKLQGGEQVKRQMPGI